MTTATEKATYVVTARGTQHSTHRTEQAAIKVAAALPAEDDPSVAMLVESGTYRSRTEVWPVRGDTRHN